MPTNTHTNNTIAPALDKLTARIRAAEADYGRESGSVKLLAVSKTKPASMIKAAYSWGQRAFGENYLQDALPKIEQLRDLECEWHFIGPVQSNKTSNISTHFDWLHSLDRLKIAQRLSDHRPTDLPPLNVCIQVNVSGETSKSGIDTKQLQPLADAIVKMPGLKLRGLMTIPAPAQDFETQCQPLRQLAKLYLQLQEQGYELDTLSMGMSNDLEAAIASGSNLIRVGTAIFGART